MNSGHAENADGKEVEAESTGTLTLLDVIPDVSIWDGWLRFTTSLIGIGIISALVGYVASSFVYLDFKIQSMQ